MTRTKRLAGIAGIVAIAALGAFWLWASPAWTLRDMRDAARSGDAATLDAHIDYPALRESIKSQMAERIRAQAPQGAASEIALALGTGMVDAMVTPQRLRETIAGPAGGPSTEGIMRADDLGIERTGLTGFVAGSKKPEGVTGGAVFALQGLTWRIVGVRIPTAVAPQAPMPMRWPDKADRPRSAPPRK